MSEHTTHKHNDSTPTHPASHSDNEPLLENGQKEEFASDDGDMEWQRLQSHRKSSSSRVQYMLTWFPIILSIILSASVVLLFLKNTSLESRVRTLANTTPSTTTPSKPMSNLAETLQNFYGPLPAVDAPEFTTAEGHMALNNNGTWHERLGKQVLILDIDSRPLNKTNQILHDGPMQWRNFDGLSSGMLSHYAYALTHGYDYKFIRTPLYEDRFASWIKPSVIATLLRSNQYKFVVFLDNDCVFFAPNLPLEWLMNHWNIGPRTALSMPYDPVADKNLDSMGNVGFNSGFIIAQNLPRTLEILDMWDDCPNEGSLFLGCDYWKNSWPFEQGALSEHVRHRIWKEENGEDVDALAEGEDGSAEFILTTPPKEPVALLPLPCNEANGYPLNDECHGQLVRHFWIYKNLVHDGVAESFMNQAMQQLKNLLFENLEGTVVNWPGFQA